MPALLALVAALAPLSPAQGQGEPVLSALAGLTAGPVGRIASVVGAETVTITGVAAPVRLADLRIPDASGAGGRATAFGPQAAAALRARLEHQPVQLYWDDAQREDRHGRLLAHLVRLDPDGRPVAWLQEGLLLAGLARTYPDADAPQRVAALLAAEQAAREARRGLWADPAFRVWPSDAPAAIPMGFQLVAGRVIDVGKTSSTLYLNFGAEWRSDFTALISRRDWERFPGGEAGLEALAGATVRVRGWVFRSRGPAMRLSLAGAIERLE